MWFCILIQADITNKEHSIMHNILLVIIEMTLIHLYPSLLQHLIIPVPSNTQVPSSTQYSSSLYPQNTLWYSQNQLPTKSKFLWTYIYIFYLNNIRTLTYYNIIYLAITYIFHKVVFYFSFSLDINLIKY